VITTPKKDSMLAEITGISAEKATIDDPKRHSKEHPQPFHMSTPPFSPSKKLYTNFR